MTKEIDLTIDKAQLALEEAEKRILAACRRGLEETHAIGKDLIKIRDEKLYELRQYATFRDYVEEDLRMSISTAYRIIGIHDAIERLAGEGLELPSNESQAAELIKLMPERQPVVWSRVIKFSNQRDVPITVDMVKLAVKKEAERLAAEDEAKEGVKVDIEANGDQPKVISLTAKGEAALAKIAQICGKEVGQSIENLTIPITEKELIRWAEQNDDMIANVAGYVVNLRWTVKKAIEQEERSIDEDTSVRTLITMSRVRGGSLVAGIEDARITVDIDPQR